MTDPTESAGRATNAKIVFERTYRASVQELWDLWTTKELRKQESGCDAPSD